MKFNINEYFQTKVKTNVKAFIKEDEKIELDDILFNSALFVFDTETSKFKENGSYTSLTYATMLMNCDDDNNICYMHRELKDCLKYLENYPSKSTLVYAHNGGKFDFKNMLYSLLEMGYSINRSVLNKTVFNCFEKEKFVKREISDTKRIDIKFKDGKYYELKLTVCYFTDIKIGKQGRKNVYKTIFGVENYKNYLRETIKNEKEIDKLVKKNMKVKTITFRDTYLLLSSSLDELCREYLKLYLPKSNLNYNIFRDKNTVLTDNEYLYCYGDVFGLKYLVKEVLNTNFKFELNSYNKCSEAFVYSEQSNKYITDRIVERKVGNRLIKTFELDDIFNISDLEIKLSDKLTSASFSFAILKRFLHYEVVKTLVYLLLNPDYNKNEFQQYLYEEYNKNLNQRIEKLDRDIKNGKKKKGATVDPFSYEDSYRLIFPKLNKAIIDNNQRINATLWLKEAYHGGRCFIGKNFYNMYHKDKFSHHVKCNGSALDCNSLYPYQLFEKYMPYGFYTEVSQEEFKNNKSKYLNEKFSFIKFRTFGEVKLKENKFPMLRVTNKICEGYKGSECFINNFDKNKRITNMNLTLCSTDYKNFFDSYEVETCIAFKVLTFNKVKGLFNSFVSYFYEMKRNSSGTQRLLAKLILNSSYGKMGTKPISNDINVVFNEETGIVEYNKSYVCKNNKNDENYYLSFDKEEVNSYNYIEEVSILEEPFYMPVACCVTAEGRNDLKKQCEMIGLNHFLYCDTDSVHTDLPYSKLQEICNNIHDKDIGKWALDSEYSEGIYLGSKRYAEKTRISKSKNYKLDNFSLYFWGIKCCGIPSKTRKKIAYNIDDFNFCKMKTSDFKKNLKNKNIVPISNDYRYYNKLTNEIVKGAFVVQKSREVKNGIVILDTPYLLTDELYLDGSDID